MRIQTHTDNHIDGSVELDKYAGAVVENAIGHLAERITRVDIHLCDENGEKGGHSDKRCSMEAHLKGHQPLTVRHAAETIGQAVQGAADKLKHALDHVLGRLRHVRVRTT